MTGQRKKARKDSDPELLSATDYDDESVTKKDEKVLAARKASSTQSLRRSPSAPNLQTIATKRPKDTAFKQQRLPAWQPILTPYNVIPTLFILAFVFIPLGVVFLIFSGQVQEYSFDYTNCLTDALVDKFSTAPASLGNTPFEWRRLSAFPTYAQQSSSDFKYNSAASLCELRFDVTKGISGPIFQYYRLYNFYQNQRLYVKSVDWQQLKGVAKPAAALNDCAPLVKPGGTNANGAELVYYPCGLIANSMFNDTIGSMARMTGGAPVQWYEFPPKDIAWPYEKDRYGPTSYSLDQVRPPPFWLNNKKLVNDDGTYRRLPDFRNDERFQNWMKVSGLPVFRKPYGKHVDNIPAGTFTVLISSNYDVASFGARKSLIISNTSWIGGKNSFLGWAYIVTGAVFLLLGAAFLIRHLIAPRRLGDARYLAWGNESSAPISE